MSARKHLSALLFSGIIAILSPGTVEAGNPLWISRTGEPYRWDANSPITIYPSTGRLGQLSNEDAINSLLCPALDTWAAVPTARIRWHLQRDLVRSVESQQELKLMLDQGYSPIVFDERGRLLASFGLPTQAVIAAAGPYKAAGGTIVQGFVIVNGLMLDGNASNGEISRDEMFAAIIHELGHFLNLDHSQVNGHILQGDASDPTVQVFGPPPADAPLEIMYPFLMRGISRPSLSRDDTTAISSLYPSELQQAYGGVSGRVFLSNGRTPFQGAGIVARNVHDPYRDAVASVSGVRFAGQSGGSSDIQYKGLYEIDGLVPGASYALELSALVPVSSAGSSIGPLFPHAKLPGPEEFHNGSGEGPSDPPDDTLEFTPVSVPPDSRIASIDFIFNAGPEDGLFVPNPGFEIQGNNNLPAAWEVAWVNSGAGDAARYHTRDAFEGESVLRLHTGAGGGSIFVVSDPFPAVSNTTYLLSCRMRFNFDQDPGSAVFTILQYDRDGNDLGSTDVASAAGESTWSWTQVYTVLKTAPNAAYLRIRFGLLTLSERYLDVDDIQIQNEYSAGGRVSNLSGQAATIEFSLMTGQGPVPPPVVADSDGRWCQSGFRLGNLYRAAARSAGRDFTPPSHSFNRPANNLNFSAAVWHSEAVDWPVSYGRNWVSSGKVFKPGATRIRLHFRAISLGHPADRLTSDAGDAWTGSFTDVTTKDKAGDSLTLALVSGPAGTGSFVIDRVEYIGNVTGAARRSNPFFSAPERCGVLEITFTPNPVRRSADGRWRYHVQLAETGGLGVTLTGLRVGGRDYSEDLIEWFGSRRIPALGRLDGYFVTWSNVAPLYLTWEVTTVDDLRHPARVWSGAVLLEK